MRARVTRRCQAAVSCHRQPAPLVTLHDGPREGIWAIEEIGDGLHLSLAEEGANACARDGRTVMPHGRQDGDTEAQLVSRLAQCLDRTSLRPPEGEVVTDDDLTSLEVAAQDPPDEGSRLDLREVMGEVCPHEAIETRTGQHVDLLVPRSEQRGRSVRAQNGTRMADESEDGAGNPELAGPQARGLDDALVTPMQAIEHPDRDDRGPMARVLEGGWVFESQNFHGKTLDSEQVEG